MKNLLLVILGFIFITGSFMVSAQTNVSDEAKSPSIYLLAKSNMQKATSTVITIEKGSKFQISGQPKNLKGLKYGDSGFTASWNFGSILDCSCSNTKMKSKGLWRFKCKANKIGSTDVYVEIYKDGIVYSSNKIKVNVIEKNNSRSKNISNVGDKVDTSDTKSQSLPNIKIVRGKAMEDFEINANEATSISGTNLIFGGKDARVFVGNIEAKVTQHNDQVLYFIVPDMESGTYNLYVETSVGISNKVKVKVYGKG